MTLPPNPEQAGGVKSWKLDSEDASGTTHKVGADGRGASLVELLGVDGVLEAFTHLPTHTQREPQSPDSLENTGFYSSNYREKTP